MLEESIIETFTKMFKRTPKLFFSPGRINLIGEHVDYNDGFVIPAAIDKGIWFAIAPNHSDTANFYSADFNEKYSTELSSISLKKGWQNYLLGIIDQIQKRKLIIDGFDCVFGGNLPVGAGMSSSAALECGLLYALNEIFNLRLHRLEMAQIAQQAEHTFPGVMCGIMDQFATIMGKADHVILLDCMSLNYNYVPVDLQGYSLILINSKVHHSLADGEYNNRRQQCQEGFKILQTKLSNVKSFRDITPSQVEQNKRYLDYKIYKRILYVTQEIERTEKAAMFLERNQLKEFGQLMFQTHDGLSELYEVSCNELDFLVNRAKGQPSIIGSRVMGGGFGGCTINLISKSNSEEVVDNIVAAYKMKYGIEAETYEVTTGNRTFEVKDLMFEKDD